MKVQPLPLFKVKIQTNSGEEEMEFFSSDNMSARRKVFFLIDLHKANGATLYRGDDLIATFASYDDIRNCE